MIARRSAVVLSGSSHPELARAVRDELDLPELECSCQRFPDGEQHVELDGDLSGRAAILVQTGLAPIGEHLLELALLADTCRRAGAERLVAVMPYFPYSRQDRRRPGQPLGVRVVGELLGAMRLDRAISFDLHSSATEAALPLVLDELSAVPLLAAALREHLPASAIVVAPDLGASKLARRYGSELGLPLAIVHKRRISGSEVEAEQIIGEVRGRRPLLVDDIISSGGTIAAASRALLAAGGLPPFTVAATHAVLSGNAVEQLESVPIDRLVFSNSLPVRATFSFEARAVDLTPVIANALERVLCLSLET